jgi:alkaline phosphatase D
MPVRLDGTADLRDGSRLFRRLQFGRLAEVSMLDLRSYRDKQVKPLLPFPVPTTSPDVSAPDRSILGGAQMRWLKQSLSRRQAQWKIIGNPVMIAPISFVQLPADVLGPVNDVTGLLPDDGFPFNVDQWDGYTDDRREIYAHIRDHQIKDTVFVTGDIHSGWAAELPYDVGAYPIKADSAGVEFVCTSVTSANLKDILGTPPHTASTLVETVILANNRHLKYLNFDDHGFSVLDITPARTQMDWYIIGDRADRATPIKWTRSFATKTGTGRVGRVDRPVR